MMCREFWICGPLAVVPAVQLSQISETGLTDGGSGWLGKGNHRLRILLIEDDKNVAGFVIKGLREEGHNVTHADCAQVGIERFTAEKYDVIILDRILPDAPDGLELVRSLRAQQNNTPVLILSGLGEANNKVSGLKAGGDDYLAKPFAFAELLARIEALVRRGRVG
jgi:two-component system OmpR family response regulator